VTFGEHLRALRLAADLSQDQLAVRAALHRSLISQLERIPGRGVSLETAVRVAGGLGVPPARIIDVYMISSDRRARR
jgi:transcriptional regulator with XRE-family HTH domain